MQKSQTLALDKMGMECRLPSSYRTSERTPISAVRPIVNANGLALKTSPMNKESKVKIRLVSPLSQERNKDIMKENGGELASKSSTTLNKEQRLPTQKERRNNQIVSRENKDATRSTIIAPQIAINAHSLIPFIAQPNKFYNKENKIFIQSIIPIPASPIRGPLPNRIHFNNRTFEIGSHQPNTASVPPLDRRQSKAASHPSPKAECIRQSNVSQASINQQMIQDLQDSCQSELEEIRQLQRDIEDNNLKIRALLKASNRMGSDSQISMGYERYQKVGASNCPNINPSMETKQTLINQLDFAHNSTPPCSRDEISVQTEGPQVLKQQYLKKNGRKAPKFAIFRNNQCQIQLISSDIRVHQKLSLDSEESRESFHMMGKTASNQVDNQPKINSIKCSIIPEQIDEVTTPSSQRSLKQNNDILFQENNAKLEDRTDKTSPIEDQSIKQTQQPATVLVSSQPVSSRASNTLSSSKQTPIQIIKKYSGMQSNYSSTKSQSKQSKPPSTSVGQAKGNSAGGGRRMNNARYL